MQTELAPFNPLRADASTIECRNPATLERLGDVPALSRVEVEERVARGRRAQAAWGKTSFAERRRVMKKMLAYIVDHQAEICRLAARDSGNTMNDAALGEVFPVVEKLRWLVQHGEQVLAPEPRSSGLLAHKAARVEYAALGVIGVLCPWSFPFHSIFGPVLPALFAGNAIVCKVSEWTSWSAADFQAMFDDVLTGCGHSTDLVQIITGARDTGLALVTSGVEKIFFTGSPSNGKKVMEAASQTITPVVLELGGKDAMIICDDADLDQAVEAAMLGVFTACGQRCGAAERLYVMEGIYDRFVERVVDQVRRLRQGPPSGDAEGRYDVGAMTLPRQLDIVARQIDDAMKKGARVLVGGVRNPVWKGQFFEPTILVECDHTMAITREETFGPVMTIIRVATEREAVRMANDSDYGLGASVFTKSGARAERMARALSAGTIVVNDAGIAHRVQDAPFGGLRSSGFGKINGREGLRACTAEKTIVTDRFPIHLAPKLHLSYPMGRGSYGLVEGAIGIIYGDARQKLAGVTRLAKTLTNKWQASRKPARRTTSEHYS
jgi:acyl-CoA reductase-like NAD-dependent aldehyde dehydrogenase